MLLALAAGSPRLIAQERDGSTGAAIGGALLGTYSGAVLGLLGGFGPCNRTLSGPRCPRIALAIGGALGLASGLRMGAGDPDALDGRWRSAGYGGIVGGLVGAGLSLGVRQYGWQDAGMFLAVGAGIGASPVGAGIGFAAGAAVGALGWMVIPEWKIGDTVAVSLVGLAAGGLAGWVTGTDTRGRQRPLLVPLQFRF
jgi:hypothetical protein